jgi:hypothetical protein
LTSATTTLTGVAIRNPDTIHHDSHEQLLGQIKTKFPGQKLVYLFIDFGNRLNHGTYPIMNQQTSPLG